MPKLTRTRLTLRTVKDTKPNARLRFLWDEEVPGLGLAIYPGGRKSYVIQFRTGSGVCRRVKLGLAGRLTLDEARIEARAKLGEVDKGADPSRVRKAARRAPTVEALANRYLEEHCRPKKKPSSVKTDDRLLRLVILPALGALRVAQVTSADVSRMHHDHRSTPVQANRAVTLLSKLMNLAERWGLRPQGSNPCRHAERFREKARNRFLSPAELARLGDALALAERSEHSSAVLALWLLILTGCRRSEILQLRWDEVDLAGGALNFRDSKTGEKTVPLGPPALEKLSRAERLAGNPFVCWGERPGAHLVGIDKAWRRIKETAGLENLRLHDLRHSFASVGASGGFGLPILGGLLGHTSPATTNRYAHLANDPLRVAMDRISSEIAAAMGGGGGEVREFRR